jgi:hypothetical protein
MINDLQRLTELVEEVSEKPLEWRRRYLKDMETAFGEAAAQQIRDGLTRLWAERKR